jgi:hypothetical protein
MKKILAITLALLLTGCASTQPKIVVKNHLEIYVPNAIEQPAAPKLKKYDTRYDMSHPYNFRTFQENQLALSDYIVSLKSTISYYESQIEKGKEKQKELERE